MKKIYYFFALLVTISACKPQIKGDPDRFKTGVFEAPAVEGSISKTTITRNDSLQIEKYIKYTEISTDSGSYVREEQKTDVYYIQWGNNFFYTLRMKDPKTDIDEDPIFVQITKISENTYGFSAKIGYSNFKQTGTVTKIE